MWNYSKIFTRFTNIINGLKAFDINIFNVESKILQSLPKNWEPKVIASLKARDLSKLDLDQFICLTYYSWDDWFKWRWEEKRKDLALKAYPNDDDKDFSEEDLVLLSNKFKERRWHQHCKEREQTWQEQKEESSHSWVCFSVSSH